MIRRWFSLFLLCSFSTFSWATVTFDFESASLEHGERIEGQTLGGLFTISSNTTGSNHLGATIFDSNLSGTADADLEVDLGNIVMLQNNNFGTFKSPGVYQTPNDDPGGGVITLLFTRPVQLESIDLIDIDDNAYADVVLTDTGNRERTFHAPNDWTYDISVSGPKGYDTLYLNTLAPQLGEGGAIATAFEDVGFNVMQIQKMTVTLGGSGGFDNVSYVPTPGALLLCSLGTISIGVLKRRKSL